MKKSKKPENKLIYWWVKYFKKYEEGCKKTGQPFDVRIYARDQLDMIENAKPDKTKKIDSQLNEEQLEYVKWLRYVADTGEIDNEIYRNS